MPANSDNYLSVKALCLVLPGAFFGNTFLKTIKPIDAAMQQRIVLEVERYLDYGRSLYQLPLPSIPVVFTLKGRAAGMYRVKRTGYLASTVREIRFNPWIFAKYPEDSWRNTIPHEVAHYIADCRYGPRIRPHGVQWQQIMQDFGAEPSVCGQYDLTGIPQRQMQRYTYQCACGQVQLSARRHHKVQRGCQYRCVSCQQILTPVL